MSRRRLASGAVAAGVLTAAVGLGLGQLPAAAATPSAGWWSRTTLPGLPNRALAPFVPAGGLYVSQGSDQPVAVSAIRIEVPAGATATLTLGLADGASDGIAVSACPTTSAWEATDGGAYETAPAWDCALGAALGAVDPGAGTVTWALPASFARDGLVDVALVPTVGALPFSAPFAAPTDDGVIVRSGAAPGPTGSTPGGVEGAQRDRPAPASPTLPEASRPASPGVTPFTPALAIPPGGEPATPTPAAADLATAPFAGEVDEPTAPRVLAAVLTVLLGAAAARIGLRSAGAGAGAGGDDRQRGIGRFARPRSGPPLAI